MSPGTTLFGWPAAAATCAVTLLPFLGRKWTGRGYKYLGNISHGLYAYHVFWIMTVDQLFSIQHRL
jgi:peptidoglycan/LPS O-acetylase OafA/YrhL